MSRLTRADLRPTGAGRDERREELLRAATRLFARRGYHATTVEDVVAEAGVAKGTVYWYYRSKKALFLAVLERAASALREELVRRLGEVRSPLARVEAAVEAVMRLAAEHPELYRLYFQQVLDGDEVFVRERGRIHATFLGELRATLEEAMEQGEVPPGDAELLARMVLGAVEAATAYAAERLRVPPEAARFVAGGLRHGSA